jgi:hypothetical protein
VARRLLQARAERTLQEVLMSPRAPTASQPVAPARHPAVLSDPKPGGRARLVLGLVVPLLVLTVGERATLGGACQTSGAPSLAVSEAPRLRASDRAQLPPRPAASPGNEASADRDFEPLGQLQ